MVTDGTRVPGKDPAPPERDCVSGTGEPVCSEIAGLTLRSKGAELAEARRAARARYAAIAELLKREAGVTRHYRFKKIGGLAFTGTGKILAPEGVTRRQLYVLAHECGHIVLHGSRAARLRPNHVIEHEAEVYAHRAFDRYGVVVPEKSARWARAYVGQWIMKDRAAGLAIDDAALKFALGEADHRVALPNLANQPANDFSRQIARFTAQGVREVEKQEAQIVQAQGPSQVLVAPQASNTTLSSPYFTVPVRGLSVTCATCLYSTFDSARTAYGFCRVYRMSIVLSEMRATACPSGESWRPSPSSVLELRRAYEAIEDRRTPPADLRTPFARDAGFNLAVRVEQAGFWRRLGDALLDRLRRRG